MKYLLEYKEHLGIYDIKLQTMLRVAELEIKDPNMIETYNTVNYIYTSDEEIVGYKDEVPIIGTFNIRKYGRIYLNTNPLEKSDKYVDNSFYFFGGFEIKENYRKMGLGKQIIKKIFEKVPNLENIILFAEMNVGYPFWKKIGAEYILTLEEEDYENLYKGLLKDMDVFSGDVVLLKLKRELFL